MGASRATLTGALLIFAELALAQVPSDNLKGTWIAQSRYCGESVVVVTAVDEHGTVRGTFLCKRTGWKPVMGDKVDTNAVKGTFSGTRFVMENADGGGFDLQLEGTTLKGYGRARASLGDNPITYTKQ
jgi:hypothetical protein